VLLLGPSGTGRSRLARRMTLAEALETTHTHRVAGRTGARKAIADLAGVEAIGAAHAGEAIQYCSLDRDSGREAGVSRRIRIVRHRGGNRGSWSVTCGGSGNKTGGSRLFMSKGIIRAEGGRQRASGGNCYVAELEHCTSRVDIRHADGRGLCGLMRVSLHGSWPLPLESLSHTLRRGLCRAKGLKQWRLLRRYPLRSGDVPSCPHSLNRAGSSQRHLFPL
jgi:hypothetical protein